MKQNNIFSLFMRQSFCMFIPDLELDSILRLTPAILAEKNIRLLLLDLDNTLSEYNNSNPTDNLQKWLREIVLSGILPFIISNNRSNRPEIFASQLNIAFLGGAKKPNPKKTLKIIGDLGYDISETALVGDQIFTDILCAKRSGILAVAVRPINISAPHRALRYLLEQPFRKLCRKKI